MGRRPRNEYERLANRKAAAAAAAADPEALEDVDGTAWYTRNQDKDSAEVDEGFRPMGASVLRRRAGLAVQDPRYAGMRVSRSELDADEANEDDKAEINDSDEDNSSDDEYASSRDDDHQIHVLEDGDFGINDGINNDFEDGVSSDIDDDTNSDNNEEDDGDHGNDASAAALANEVVAEQLSELEQTEKAALTMTQSDPEADRRKGKHIQAQLASWDAAVEMRIRLHPLVALVNRLPEPSLFDELVGAAVSNRVREPLAVAREQCLEITGRLLKMQQDLAEKNDWLAGRLDAAPKRKRRFSSSGAAWDALDAWHGKFVPLMESTMEKWHSKTTVTEKRNKAYKSLNRPVMEQVRQVIADKERLRKRSRLLRAPLDIIGSPSDLIASDGELRVHSNIFNDDDFYSTLLRDVIERKSKGVDVNDMESMGRHWVELSKLRSKVKKKVDTRASKGRKLRYEVHEKLVHFMAPDDTPHKSTDQARDDLFISLFQQ